MIPFKTSPISMVGAAVLLAFLVLAMPARADLKWNGPVFQGPVLQGPVFQGPLLKGPTAASAGRIVSVTLPSGETIDLR